MREAARGSDTFTEGCNTSDWFTGNWIGTRYELTRGSSGFIFRPGRKQGEIRSRGPGIHPFSIPGALLSFSGLRFEICPQSKD